MIPSSLQPSPILCISFVHVPPILVSIQVLSVSCIYFEYESSMNTVNQTPRPRNPFFCRTLEGTLARSCGLSSQMRIPSVVLPEKASTNILRTFNSRDRIFTIEASTRIWSHQIWDHIFMYAQIENLAPPTLVIVFIKQFNNDASEKRSIFREHRGPSQARQG